MDDDDQTQAFCSECGKLIVGELVDNASKGKKAYCENCGTPFRSKIKKKEIGSPKKYEPSPRAKILKQVKSKISKQLKYQYDTQYKSVNKSSPPPPPKPSTPPTVPSPPLRSQHMVIPKKTLKDLKKVINFFNNLVASPLILILGIIATVGQIVDMFLNYSFLPSIASGIIFRIIVLVLVNSYIHEKITPRIYSGDYSKLGIDAIIMGGIACACYGLGVLVLVEGVLILVYSILVKLKTLQTHKGKSLPVELSHEILASNIIEDVIYVMNENLYKAEYFTILLGIPLLINEINFFSNLFWMFLVFFIIALIMLNFVKTTFNSTLKLTPFAKLDESFIVKALVLGGFCVVFGGSGALLLTVSILLFVYRDRFAEINRKLANQPKVIPIVTDRQPEITPMTAKKEEEPNKPKTSQNKRSQTKVELKNLTPLPSSQAGINVPEKKSKLQKIPEIQGKKPDKEIKTEDVESVDKDRDYLDRLFMVLSEEIRMRLLKLDIPEDQKWDVVRELINLKEEQREKFIEELENVNSKIPEKLISRVMVMKKIDNAKKEGLIHELELMSLDNQQEFVEYLESDE